MSDQLQTPDPAPLPPPPPLPQPKSGKVIVPKAPDITSTIIERGDGNNVNTR